MRGQASLTNVNYIILYFYARTFFAGCPRRDHLAIQIPAFYLFRGFTPIGDGVLWAICAQEGELECGAGRRQKKWATLSEGIWGNPNPRK